MKNLENIKNKVNWCTKTTQNAESLNSSWWLMHRHITGKHAENLWL